MRYNLLKYQITVTHLESSPARSARCSDIYLSNALHLRKQKINS